MTTYDNLREGAPRRLARYKAKLAKSLETIRACRTPEAAAEFERIGGYAGPDGWKRERYITPHGLGFAAPQSTFTHDKDGGYIYGDSGALDHLRVSDAEDILRAAGHYHTSASWYCDPYQHETITGKVCQLPTRHGRGQFLAFIVWSDSDGITIDADILDSATDAAMRAADMAERFASREMEDREREDARMALEDRIFEACETLRELRAKYRVNMRALMESRAKRCLTVPGVIRAELRRIAEDFDTLADSVRGWRDELGAME